MARQEEPSYAELVYDVLRSAERPVTFQEIFDEVDLRRPVTTRNPKATIRNALTQGRQLVSIGDGRYGYLPHLVAGSLLRLPLTEKDPAKHPLIYPDEVRHALWPSFFEAQKRRVTRPVHVKLPNGKTVPLALNFFGRGVWGSLVHEELGQYLVSSYAGPGDSLLIRVVDAEAGRHEASLEPRTKRDEAAVARRNRELSDTVYQILRKGRSEEMPIWDIVVALLAQGFYRSDVAPDPVEEVLKADPRFVNAGLNAWMLAEAVTLETRARIRQRKKLESDLYDFQQDVIADIKKALSGLALRGPMEQTMADLSAVLSEQKFGSIQEVTDALRNILTTGDLPHREVQTPLQKAQELIWDAWELTSSRERIRLARKALDLSPDCADAYVLLAEETAQRAEEAAELYAKGVAAGERALGEKPFKEKVGHFWGIIETRPYMRARAGLAQALWEMDRRQEAIEQVWDMLRLNPGDNQGMRYILLNWLLEMGDDVQIKKLLQRYRGDGAAIWLYGRALHAFRTEGDTTRARKLRAEAERGNPHVPAYLLGRKRLPKRMPDMIGIGDEREAIVCAAEQAPAWRNTPGALTWLNKRDK